MSRVSLRDLPPVPAIGAPARLSMTQLEIASRCLRSAYLYRKYAGGADSPEMFRGTAAHEMARRMVLQLVEEGSWFNDRGEVEFPRMPGEVGKDLMGVVLEENPQWVIPPREQDRLRAMAWNLAEGTVIDPDSVLAVETTVELRVGGVVLSGRIDLALREGDDAIRVRDYKTSPHVPSQEEFEGGFQLPFYAVLAAFGTPEGGFAPLGERAQWFVLEEVYPAHTREDGSLVNRETVVARSKLEDHRDYLVRLAGQVHGLLERGGEAPAVPGSYCFGSQDAPFGERCAAQHECPLPDRFKRVPPDGLGAEELALRAEFLADERRKTMDLVKAHARSSGRPVRCGRDLQFEFRPETRRSVKDWDKTLLAMRRAAELGEPFDLDQHVRESVSTPFKRCKLSAAEIEEAA